ncbi:gelsolin-like protein 2 [Bolinopsis microptera]|uniref:gelsolin-like protein 2 n=1 Tax=Bolinopsis microptera TaxID=2820187 RepID=UPI003078F4BB
MGEEKSGMVKPKEYDWKDSNMALFGSDTDRAVKKDAAGKEPAWKKCDEPKVGLKIWRIVKFIVTDWPEEDYSSFYSGDSYIILNTWLEQDEIKYDLHFWIGKHSTQDEYGTAAYKTVELDTYLDDKPIQHREVQGYESDLFMTYFNGMISIMEGGAETGFRHVPPECYEPRLLQLVGGRTDVVVKEVGMWKERINSDDVFVLDAGLRILQFNGKNANKDEQMKGAQYCAKLRSDRPKAKMEVSDEDCDGTRLIMKSLRDGGPPKEENVRYEAKPEDRVVLRLTEKADKSYDFAEVGKGADLEGLVLDQGDVYIVDTGAHCYVWIGTGASDGEKANGFSYASTYLAHSSHPFCPISILVQETDLPCKQETIGKK